MRGGDTGVGAYTSTADQVVVHRATRGKHFAPGAGPGRDPGEPAAPRPGDGDPVPRLGYQPALDGIRAVALAGVLFFHHGYSWAPAGFLGVSTFFTLSGFLIATLSLTEWDETGRLSPAHFYERRARRLLPAALLTFVGVVVLRAFTDIGAGDGFRPDLLAALGYAANWRFAATGDGYAALFAEPSPVLHFWSLAIEEQFYLVFPLLFVGVMAAARRWAKNSGAAVVAGGGFFALVAAASFAVAYVAAEQNGNDGTTYYGTHTRAGELLAGVVLAFVVRSRWFRQVVATRWASTALWVAGPAALAGLVYLWHEAALDGPHLFQGVTLANAGLTCLLIVAALQKGPVAAGLAVWPLRGLGKISYAAYLFHWPIFLWLTPPRVQLGTDRLLALRLVVTFAAATLSYHLLEAPFRFRLRVPRPRLAAGLVTAGVLVAALVAYAPQREVEGIDFTAAVTARPAPSDDDPEDGAGAGAGGEIEPQFPFLRQEGLIRPLDGSPPVARILLAGDSMSASMVEGLEVWNVNHPDQQIWVNTHSVFGCPLVATGVTPLEVTWPTTPECFDWHEKLGAALVMWDIDVVFFVMGLADLQGHEIDGKLTDLGDPVHDEWFAGEIGKVADTLTSRGVPVVWSN